MDQFDEDYRNNIKNKIKFILFFLLYLLIVNIILFLFSKITSTSIFIPYSSKIKKITINKGKSLRIGIISDFQLSSRHKNNNIKIRSASKNLYQTFSVLKKKKVDLILIAGDISNSGLKSDFELYKKILNSVYNDTMPKIISIMGNHDYNDKKYPLIERQRQFYELIGDYPFSHYIINNYHFIFWSNDKEAKPQNKRVENNEWINKHLKIAKEHLKKKGDPIFVITHMHPLGTVYGEKIWGNKIIFDTLKKYSEIICFSGHSHYSLRNDNSIWQKEFTAINTQSISYVDLDNDFVNSEKVRIESSNNSYMGIIAKLNENKITMERIYFLTEEILEDKWEINFPINSSNFNYTIEKLKNNIKPPFFEDFSKIEYDKNKRIIKFLSAKSEKIVHHYNIKFIDSNNNEKILKFYSDYYFIPKLRKNETEFFIPKKKLKNGNYKIEIYAIDSFNQSSQPLISNINF